MPGRFREYALVARADEQLLLHPQSLQLEWVRTNLARASQGGETMWLEKIATVNLFPITTVRRVEKL